jgi:murE/murF fusion protein
MAGRARGPAAAAACAPTAARCARVTASSPGPATPPTGGVRAGGAGRRCRGLPGGSRRRRGLRRLGGPRVATLHGLKAAAGAVADTYFAQPSAVLDVVATTGTNGKTSTAWWTAQALTRLGRRCGVIGTLGWVNRLGRLRRAMRSVRIHRPDHARPGHAARRLSGFVDQGFAGLRAGSLVHRHRRTPPGQARIDVALFTNFTRDHLDYHGSMAAYWAAKRALFDWPGLRAAVINIDDEQGAALAANWPRGPLRPRWTCGPCRCTARRGCRRWTCTTTTAAWPSPWWKGQRSVRGAQPAGGRIQRQQPAGGAGRPARAGRAAGRRRRRGAALTPVPGRMQRVAGGDVEVVVDYAHTPDALDKVLQRCARWPRRAAAGCGACSAAAATATPPSAR